MKAEWKDFLEHNGAECDDGIVNSFGNPVRERRMALSGDVFADLSHDGFIAVHGEDAGSFLQGQFSNDIGLVSETQTQLSSYCNPKGRMLAIFRVFKRGETYYLRMPGELIDSIIARLKMFVLRASVTIEDASESFVGLGISGPKAIGKLQQATGLNTETIGQSAQNDIFFTVRVPGALPRFEIYGPAEPMQKVWNTLNVHGAPIGYEAWELLNILAGIPTLYTETTEAFVPQMTNLHLIDGVSFKKGCYPGQEIVARMQYLGKLKRRMYLARSKADNVPSRGTDLFDCRKAGSQPVGKIVNVMPHPDGGVAMLAVIQIDDAEGGEICIGESGGAALALQELPYHF